MFERSEPTFLSNYIGALKDNDPKLFDFFLAEAKKRNLIRRSTNSINMTTATKKKAQVGVLYGREI